MELLKKKAPQRNHESGSGQAAVMEGEVLARLVCSATEIYPEGEGEDLRHCTETFTLCLTADGRLCTDQASTSLPWYALPGNTRTVVRTDEGGWRGVCSSDGHVTLQASGGLPKSEAQAQAQATSVDRLLAGRLLPPCSLAGTVTTTSAEVPTGRFEIVIVSVELVAAGQPAVPATWDHLLGLLKRLRAYERSQGSTANGQGGPGDDSGGGGGADFSAYLPLEAIFSVCSFLPVCDVQSLGRCSHVFHRICSDPWLWKQLYQRRFGPHTLLAPQVAAAGGDDPRAQQTAIEDLREGFSTPVADVRSIWKSQPWPKTTPGRRRRGQEKDDDNEEVDWKRRYELATRKDSGYLSSLVINDGLYIVDGHTQNSASSGNVTRVQGTRLRLMHGLLWAEMQYSSGSSYNRQAGAVWVGRYDRASRVVEWRERYATHSGLFHYTGRVVDHHTIVGTYRWDVNSATGTFELHLAQPEDHSRPL